MATLWIALGAIAAAFIARGVKISEFRQAWIDGLRSDISEYVSKANEWINLYLEFNSDVGIAKKVEVASKIDPIKYDALHVLRRVELRFKANDHDANALIDKLRNLLNPEKLAPQNGYYSWNRLANEAIVSARVLLKEEWETTKNPLRKLYKLWKTQ